MYLFHKLSQSEILDQEEEFVGMSSGFKIATENE